MKVLLEEITDLAETETIDINNFFGIYRNMLDALETPVCLVSIPGDFLFFNTVACRNMNLPLQQIAGHNEREFFSTEHCQKYSQRRLEGVKTGKSKSYIDEILLPSGVVQVFLTVMTPIKDKKGCDYSLAVSHDITEQRQNEKLLKKYTQQINSSHLRHSVNEISSTIAHELNQPLSAISLYASSAKRCLALPEEKDKVEQALTRIEEMVERLGHSIHSIKERFSTTVTNFELVDINACINHVMEVFAPKLAINNIKLNKRLETKHIVLKLDKLQFEQALGNIVQNAVDSLSHLSRPGVIIVSVSDSDNYVEVSIDDNGNGISKEEHNKLFGSFYSTKINGLGLGLAICKNIIEKHCGKLTLSNNRAGGCRVTIRLPKKVSDN